MNYSQASENTVIPFPSFSVYEGFTKRFYKFLNMCAKYLDETIIITFGSRMQTHICDKVYLEEVKSEFQDLPKPVTIPAEIRGSALVTKVRN